jgi:ribosomal protein S18 acetylase RimI-like enzyme
MIMMDEDGRSVIGLLKALTVFAEIYVDTLWIDFCHRKKGLGRELLEELERQFKGKGYWCIALCTSEYQAPEFYKKCSFELEFVRKNHLYPQLTKYFFVKYFKNEIQTQGILQR